jgi:hypothetical protein
MVGGLNLSALSDSPHDTLRGSWGTHFEVDFYGGLDAGGVGSEAGPWVFGWGGDEASGYGVAVKVAKFLYALGGGEDVEVVIAREPEGGFGTLLGD